MGKKKVTDKDIRSIEFAIDSVFPGASGEAAKQPVGCRLVKGEGQLNGKANRRSK